MSAGTPPVHGAVLIDGLLSARAYPHPVREPVRMAETHISWVMLTGDYAYKIKKPLRLSFVDYSTLERRRACCEEEVRLNRRLAPDLYLGVSPICGHPAQPAVDGSGMPIEYAVRMRQFASQDELVALLRTNGVAAEDLEQLGAGIARLHDAAGRAPSASGFGDPSTVHRVTLDNFTELRRLPEASGWDCLQPLQQRLDALHADHEPLMHERRGRGWIRECHGDLHCGNVVRWQGRLTPFDGIEFDAALRFIDVASDLAFLTMDLAERGRADLRLAVLQSWTETLGDFAGLALLPYYETYRALVRAKVAALRALQSAGAQAARVAATAECRRYVDWATDRLGPPRSCLVITCGLSGSGKTWLARRLRAPLGALHVRSDVERKRLAGLAPLADSRSPPDAGIYTQGHTTRTYDRLFECAAAALAGGLSIIVDGAFLRRDERLRFQTLAEATGTRFVLVHCTAPDDVLRQRVSARSAARNDASEAGLEVLLRQPSWWEGFDDRERSSLVEVDTGTVASVDAVLETVRARAG